jgi:hypothetical protein
MYDTWCLHEAIKFGALVDEPDEGITIGVMATAYGRQHVNVRLHPHKAQILHTYT